MKVAIPSRDEKGLESEVEEHFGRARYYTIVSIEGGEIREVEVVENPFPSHGPGDIPRFLKERGVNAVLVGRVGVRARRFFNEMGIAVLDGFSGKVGDAVKAYIKK